MRRRLNLLKLRLLLLVLLCLTLVPLLTGCYFAVGSGQIETRSYDLDDFDRVSVSHAFEADISYADEYSVSVTADDNLFRYIEVLQRGNNLEIGLKPGVTLRRGQLQASVTLLHLEGLDISGASTVRVSGFQDAPLFDVDVSGASRLDLAETVLGNTNFDISGASRLELLSVRAEDTDFEISGASRVNGELEMHNGDIEVSGASNLELNGSAGNLELEASGASKLNLVTFPLHDMDLVLSGASHGTVNLDGRLDLELSGASILYYHGSPQLGRVDISGASTLVQK